MPTSIMHIFAWFRAAPIRGIMLLAAMLRLGLWWGKFGRPGYRHLFRDDEVYWQAAQSFLETGQFGSPKVMPVLPLLEAVLGFPGIIYLHIILGILTVWIVYQLGRLLLGNRAATWSALLIALSPGLLYFSNHAYTEVPFTFLLVFGIWQFYRKRYWVGSIVWAGSILLRPTLDLLGPVMVIAFAWLVHQEAKGKTLLRIGQYLLVYVLMMAPWWAYNYQNYGHFVRLNLGAGEVMYHGQVVLPQLEDLDDPAVYDLGPYADIEDPAERNEALTKAVRQQWRSHPLALPKAFYRNALKFWLGTPEVFYGAFKFLAGFWGHALLLLAIVACFISPAIRTRKWIPFALLILYFTVGHSLLHGMPRYRLPLEPFLVILAAELLQRLFPLTWAIDPSAKDQP